MTKKPYKQPALRDTYFHVRSSDGVTVHWMDWEQPARRLASAEGYEVYRVERLKGAAFRIQ